MPTKKPAGAKATRSRKVEPILPGVNPAVEDHATPETSVPFPIVAVGASAGGLEAFTEMLKGLPDDTGMAFVMIQHLSPTHSSMLPEILTRATSIPVAQVENNMPVEPDHVYVIPPGQDMVLSDGRLQLSPRTELRGVARPIDQFMRSLAEEHGHKAIAIVLSGTGNDGTLGIDEVKAAGGITFVQDSSAGHDGMPRSAIAGGSVDFILSPREIARELGRIAQHPYVSPALDEGDAALSEGDLQHVIGMLKESSGVDFTNYKHNTLYRRITRRMALNKLVSARAYLKQLKGNAEEMEALYQDVLINVTSFFRNPEAYEALKTEIFPKLTSERGRHEQVRVWALGCSTGEEAYSVAIAYSEFLESSGRRIPLQVFATDLNGAGIEKARAGIYGKGIAQDVSAERLRRYFVEFDGSYRIAKPIRDMCVFARQNVLADPPFSRIDLVACRNMLIYMEPVLQHRLIPMLHYALRGDGYLWLGNSETIGSYRDLFEPIDAKNRIYAKKGPSRSVASIPMASPRWMRHPVPQVGAQQEVRANDAQKEADRILINRYAPPGVVLNEGHEILQFRGDTSPFLRPAPGKASLNFLKMLREGLMVAARGALSRARRDQVVAREEGLRVRSNGGWRTVDVVVVPLKGNDIAPGSVLVLFEEPAHSVDARSRQLDADARAAALVPAPEDVGGGEHEITRLKQELSATRDYLQSVIEQQEAANEELQSANEEVQSANEELQSINEELETSKEEIQSSNEELATVNDELQNRNRELTQSTNDFANLFSSVQMPIVMLGRDLRIRRFTPAAEKVLNLIPSDVGRPIGDIKMNLSIDDFEQMVVEVIDSVAVREREVRLRGERSYLLRVHPYRTLEDKIDGAVVVLIDIEGLRVAEKALKVSEKALQDSRDRYDALDRRKNPGKD
jgi:two-component system CheB/CheR fusion protein